MSAPSHQRRLKAVALSGLVLPGAGQLHLGARVRGVLLIAATTGLLALFVLRCLEAVIEAAALSPVGFDLAQVREIVGRHGVRLVPVVLGLFVVWVAAIADAWFAPGVAMPETSGDTEGRSQQGRSAS